MGMVSFAIADAARRRARPSPAASRSAAILPGEGVELEDGTTTPRLDRDLQRGPEADARPARRLDLDAAYRERLEAWKVRSPVVKFNAALERLPNWTAAPGERWPAQATDRRLRDDGRGAGGVRALRGRRAGGRLRRDLRADRLRPDARARGQAPDVSVFGQYAPYDIADGDWDSRRDDGRRAVRRPDRALRPGHRTACISFHEVLGPPDIESRIGLTGGNIFQGEVTPDQMWEGRLCARTPGRPASTSAAPAPTRPAA